MLNRNIRTFLLVALLALAGGALAACQDSRDESSTNPNWGPHGGSQGMGGMGPSAEPGG
jgi:hypothetical protein